ncbi:DUF3368 domain-containing protein [Coleofasciculus sp.]|uniref:DUF3368 domain-containing protein n=1 Tax=Coleofasciculus sp. TaxID=3100458 RepID=UPI003A335A2D
MIVVSNTSPISNLAVLGNLPLLQQVYHTIIIPTAVADEIAQVATIYTQAATVPTLDWIQIQNLTNNDNELIESLGEELDAGEAEAIALALELNADLLLIDEQLGRTVASRYGLKVKGLLGVLVTAKRLGMISAVKPVMDDLIVQARFRVSQQLYTDVLQAAGE